MAADGQITIDVTLNDGSVVQGVANINNQFNDLDQNSDSKLKKLGAGLKKLAGIAAIGVGAIAGIGAAVVGLAKPLVEAAGAAQALNSQFSQVFGEMESAATASLNKIAEETSIMPERLKGSFVQMAAFAKTSGMDTASALDLTSRATLAAADSAAFYDRSIEDVTENLQSFLKGNFENDAALGISATETTRNAKANELYGQSFVKLSEQQKQLTLLAMVEDGNKLSGALGQASREGDGLENVIGNLKQAWENLKVKLGEPILDIAINALKTLTNIIDNFDITPFVNAFNRVKEVVGPAIQTVVSAIQNVIASGKLTEVIDLVKGYLDVIKTEITVLKEFWANEGQATIDKVVAIFNSLKAIVLPIVQDAITTIKNVFAQVKEFWEKDGQQFLKAVQNVFNGILTVVNFIMPVVKFVVDYVWTAIKNVITGALNVIIGVLKVFTGLFTGDWSKLWEGVKQLFSGAIKLILGIMSLTFVGGIRTALVNLGKVGINLVKGLWDDIGKLFAKAGSSIPAIVNKMANAVVNWFKNIWTQGSNIFGTLRTFGANTFTALKDAVVTVVRNLVTNVINFIRNMSTNFVGTLTSMRSQVIDKIKAVKDGIVNKIKEVDLFQIGKDIISGLINGIGAMTTKAIESITGVVNGIINKAKSLLDIHSPSRVFKEIGVNTGTGLANGITSTKAINLKAIKDITTVLKKATKDNAKEVKAIATTASKERTEIEQKYAKQRKEQLTSNKEAIAKIEKNLAKELASVDSKKYKKAALKTAARNKVIAKYNDQRVEQEKKSAKALAKIEANLQVDLKKISNTSKKDTKAKESELNALKLEYVQQYIEDKKEANKISLFEEAQYYREAYKLMKNGSEEQAKLQKAYKDTVATINDEIVSLNNDFISRQKAISDKLLSDEDEVNKKYADTFKARYETILGYFGLFDELEERESISSQVVYDILDKQLVELNKWRSELASLEARGISETLLEDLRAMGPSVLSQLEALNNMTGEQLTEYQKLYEQKMAFAAELATKELIPLKQSTEEQIIAMRAAANIELEALNKEWQQAIYNVVRGTEEQFSTLQQVGKNAAQGLLNGLTDMQPSLAKKAKEIADTIKNTIQKALDIHSPSRWMRDFIVGNLAKGFDIGVDKNANKFLDAAGGIVGNIINPLRGMKLDFGTIGGASSVANYSNIYNNINGSNGMPSIEPAPVILDGEKIGEIIFNTVSERQASAYNMSALVKGVNP